MTHTLDSLIETLQAVRDQAGGSLSVFAKDGAQFRSIADVIVISHNLSGRPLIASLEMLPTEAVKISQTGQYIIDLRMDAQNAPADERALMTAGAVQPGLARALVHQLHAMGFQIMHKEDVAILQDKIAKLNEGTDGPAQAV